MTRNSASNKKTSFSLSPIWNILAILTLLGACCVSIYVYLLITNPNLPINPFPPPLTATPVPTTTPTPRVFPATWTPTPTYLSLPFGTPHATSSSPVIASQTPWVTETSIPPTDTVIPPTFTLPATIPAGTFFTIANSITAIPATSKYPDSGCNWLGLGGVVTDLNGDPMNGITLLLAGTLGFDTYYQTTLSGAAPQYGAGGYEFYLGNTLTASQDTLSIQVMGNDNHPVSEKIIFDTYSDCQKNLILINIHRVN